MAQAVPADFAAVRLARAWAATGADDEHVARSSRERHEHRTGVTACGQQRQVEVRRRRAERVEHCCAHPVCGLIPPHLQDAWARRVPVDGFTADGLPR
jgi:hypothetical protein